MNPAGTKPQLLVVDDDEDIRALLRLVLERAGYEVDDQADGRAALRAFHQGNHDLVLLDVTMPGLDGWELLERIRDLSEVPVLMLTARDTEPDRVRGLRGGADDYVSKPFDREDSSPASRRCFAGRRGTTHRSRTRTRSSRSTSFSGPPPSRGSRFP